MDKKVTPLFVEGPISSRLIPVSRDHAFSFPTQLRDWIVLGLSLGQYSGHHGSSLGLDNNSETPTVQPGYTACVGRWDLSASIQELYRLVARLAGFSSRSYQ